MNYYPFHIGDYSAATRHLSWDEDAAYRRLLDVFYTTEKPLPADLRAVCRLVLASSAEQRDAVKVVLDEFWTLTDEGWVNKRAIEELARMRELQNKQREKANKRWHKPASEVGNAASGSAAMPRHTETDAAASETDADAMPPTPTPTPTPTPVESTSVLSAHAGYPTAVVDDPPNPSDPASVCIALKAMGVGGVNPGNQRLRMLLSAGAELPEFLGFVAKARDTAPGREFPYILAAVEGERRRVAATAGTLAGGRMRTKQELLEAANRQVADEWARGAVQ